MGSSPTTPTMYKKGARPSGELRTGHWAVMTTGVDKKGNPISDVVKVLSISKRRGKAVVRPNWGGRELRVDLSRLTVRKNWNRRNGPVEHQPLGTIPEHQIKKRWYTRYG